MRFPLRADPTTPTTPRHKPSGRSPAVKRTPLIENIKSDEETLAEEFGVEEAEEGRVLGTTQTTTMKRRTWIKKNLNSKDTDEDGEESDTELNKAFSSVK